MVPSGDRCLGGAGPASSPPQSTLARRQDLLPGKKKDTDLKRQSD